MIKTAALQKVSGLVVWWYQFKEYMQNCSDAKSTQINFDGNGQGQIDTFLWCKYVAKYISKFAVQVLGAH